MYLGAIGQVDGGAWWEGPLSQVSQAAADWASSEISGVPTYGGAPAFPPGYQGGAYTVQQAPSGGLVVVEEAGTPWATYALYAGGAVVAAKLLGLF